MNNLITEGCVHLKDSVKLSMPVPDTVYIKYLDNTIEARNSGNMVPKGL